MLIRISPYHQNYNNRTSAQKYKKLMISPFLAKNDRGIFGVVAAESTNRVIPPSFPGTCAIHEATFLWEGIRFSTIPRIVARQ